eukprot:jgi/Pico_ML_1/53544/g4075.t1
MEDGGKENTTNERWKDLWEKYKGKVLDFFWLLALSGLIYATLFLVFEIPCYQVEKDSPWECSTRLRWSSGGWCRSPRCPL